LTTLKVAERIMFFSRIIPTEARATIVALREGTTEDKFLDYIWEKRAMEHPRETRARGAWPFVRLAEKISAVVAATVNQELSQEQTQESMFKEAVAAKNVGALTVAHYALRRKRAKVLVASAQH
jgi:hypothetical protein